MLRPGTGTTDLLLGAFYNRSLGRLGSALVQARFESATDGVSWRF